MIKYKLCCDSDHEFEGWFRDSADFDTQAQSGLIECPVCGSAEVRKAIMAPAVARRGGSRGERFSDVKRDIGKAVERARAYVEKNFDYVGDRFPEEARKIHYGEVAERGIYGEATGKEVRDLVNEGVPVAPAPPAPASSASGKTDRAGKPKVKPAGDKKLN